MTDILDNIHQKKRQLDTLQPIPSAIISNLNDWFRIELTYTSNAIEGNTLSRQETALVVEKGITVEGKSITEHLEAVNHAKAWEYINELKNKTSIQALSERTILDIHSIILHSIDPTNAGRYRTVPVRIAGSPVILPNAVKVPRMMEEFITLVHDDSQDVVDIAILAHFKFVSIHPFTDGNGRTGRLFMNLVLMQAGYPPAIIKKEERKHYINAIEKGQLTGDLSDYYPLMYKAVERSLDMYIDALLPKSEKPIIPKKLLKIGELAKRTSETVSTIRYWTKEGLLNVQTYSQGGYQLYDETTIDRIKKIRKLKEEKRLRIIELKKYLA